MENEKFDRCGNNDQIKVEKKTTHTLLSQKHPRPSN